MKKIKYLVLSLMSTLFLVLMIIFQNYLQPACAQYEDEAYIKATLIQVSEDSLIKVTSPQNDEQVMELKDKLPRIAVGSTIEVIKGSGSIAYKSYTIRLFEGSEIIAKPTSLFLEKGSIVIEFDNKSVTLSPGESFDFEQNSKSQSD